MKVSLSREKQWTLSIVYWLDSLNGPGQGTHSVSGASVLSSYRTTDCASCGMDDEDAFKKRNNDYLKKKN